MKIQEFLRNKSSARMMASTDGGVESLATADKLEVEEDESVQVVSAQKQEEQEELAQQEENDRHAAKGGDEEECEAGGEAGGEEEDEEEDEDEDEDEEEDEDSDEDEVEEEMICFLRTSAIEHDDVSTLLRTPLSVNAYKGFLYTWYASGAGADGWLRVYCVLQHNFLLLLRDDSDEAWRKPFEVLHLLDGKLELSETSFQGKETCLKLFQDGPGGLNQDGVYLWAQSELDLVTWKGQLAFASKFKVEDLYSIEEQIGKGNFSVVCRTVHKASKKE